MKKKLKHSPWWHQREIRRQQYMDRKQKLARLSKHVDGASRFCLHVFNGRYKIFVDNLPMVSFNQIDFKGYYAFKDDHLLYGVDFYLTNNITIETTYKTKEVWLGVLNLLAEI